MISRSVQIIRNIYCNSDKDQNYYFMLHSLIFFLPRTIAQSEFRASHSVAFLLLVYFKLEQRALKYIWRRIVFHHNILSSITKKHRELATTPQCWNMRIRREVVVCAAFPQSQLPVLYLGWRDLSNRWFHMHPVRSYHQNRPKYTWCVSEFQFTPDKNKLEFTSSKNSSLVIWPIYLSNFYRLL